MATRRRALLSRSLRSARTEPRCRTTCPSGFAAATDQDGQATLEGDTCEAIQTVQIASSDHGSQRFQRENGFHAENELKLLPVAAVEGHLTADDPAAIRGVRLHLESTCKVEEGAWASSLADVISDDRGRFSVPRIVAGYVAIEAVIPEDAIYRQAARKTMNSRARKRLNSLFRSSAWVKVHGLVREKGTGKPVEGAGIRFGNARMVGPITLVGRTDASGRFEAIAPRGKETFCHPDIPKDYLKLSRGIEMPEITGDGQELPAIELERGVTLRGIVVDEEGKPVAGARVLGKWDRTGPGFKAANGATMFMGSTFSVTAKSDDHGGFLLEGIHAGANVLLQAEVGESRTGCAATCRRGLA